jgi:VanZ family protein
MCLFFAVKGTDCRMKNQIVVPGVELLAEEPIFYTMHSWMNRNPRGYSPARNLRYEEKGSLAAANGIRIGRWLPIVVCSAYLALLTVLLLSPDPAAVVGLKRIPQLPWSENGIHFCFFAGLAILAHAVRWPTPVHWLTIALLLAYGVSTETLQFFVPPRAVELKDYFENFMGVAAGTGIYWTLQRMRQVCCKSRKAVRCG